MTSSANHTRIGAPIRIFVATSSELLFELIAQLIWRQPDMTLVGHIEFSVEKSVELLLKISTGVDILILSADKAYPPPGICSQLLSEYPFLKIIVFTDGGETGSVYWLGRQQQSLGSISDVALLNDIRNIYNIDPTG